MTLFILEFSVFGRGRVKWLVDDCHPARYAGWMQKALVGEKVFRALSRLQIGHLWHWRKKDLKSLRTELQHGHRARRHLQAFPVGPGPGQVVRAECNVHMGLSNDRLLPLVRIPKY